MDTDQQVTMPMIEEGEERDEGSNTIEDEPQNDASDSTEQLLVNCCPPEPEEDEYDTDLESEQDVTDFDVSGRNLYLSACKHYRIVPVSYFVRHMKESQLVMKNHGLSTLGVKAMALALQSNTHVVSLDLESNWIGGTGGTYIAQMLKENIYITELNLANNNLRSVGCAQICDMLTYNTTLQILNLSGNKFTDADSVYFDEALSENRRLQYLNLSHNQFGEKASKLLGHGVGENETLEELDISWNYFRHRNAVEMCDQIKNNAKLKKVNLSFNGLGYEGGVAVADIIKVNNVLQELDVSHNRIPEKAAALISKNMESNEDLKVFRIGHNPIGVEGAKIMVKGISSENNRTEILDMTGVEVDKEFLAYREELLQSKKKTAVLHGGVTGDYSIKGPPLSKLRVLLNTPMDEIDFSDVLPTIKDHCNDKSFPIKDSLMTCGKLNEKNNKMPTDDFINALQQAGVCLGGRDIVVLSAMLKKIEPTVDCSVFVKD